MSYTIEKYVPIPQRPRRSKYPFSEMKVGDSFAVSAQSDEEMIAARNRLRSAISSPFHKGVAGKMKFTIRCIEDAKEVQVWRVK